MAILTNKPSSIVVGNSSPTITLTKADLISQMGITDPHWTNISNWMSVTFVYVDATGVERRHLSFVNSTSGVLSIPASALTNAWTVIGIQINDYASWVYTILRSQFPTANEFDLSVDPVLVASLLHFDPDTANAGVPFAPLTTATSWVEKNAGTNNITPVQSDWMGDNTNSIDHYSLRGFGSYNLPITSAIWGVAPAEQNILMWTRFETSDNSIYALLDSGGSNYRWRNTGGVFVTSPGSVTGPSTAMSTAGWHLVSSRVTAGNVHDIFIDGVIVATGTRTLTDFKNFGQPAAGPAGRRFGKMWAIDTVMTDQQHLDYFNFYKANYGL